MSADQPPCESPWENCRWFETGQCEQGSASIQNCRFRKPSPTKKSQSQIFEEKRSEEGGLAWSGNTLGLQELDMITLHNQPLIIGVIGSANAGKTSFLTSIYLMLCQGSQFDELQFAGSYTLSAWENLASPVRWHPGVPPQFPLRTSIGANRSPGLLHLKFRRKNNQFLDILFTDAPGEWFRSWLEDKNDPNAQGAEWIAKYADVFLMFADCEALSGIQMGKERNMVKQLTARLGDAAQERPIGVVWSKSDILIEARLRITLQKSFLQYLKCYKEFDIFALPKIRDKIQPGTGVFESLNWLIETRLNQTLAPISVAPIDQTNPFLAYRNRYES